MTACGSTPRPPRPRASGRHAQGPARRRDRHHQHLAGHEPDPGRGLQRRGPRLGLPVRRRHGHRDPAVPLAARAAEQGPGAHEAGAPRRPRRPDHPWLPDAAEGRAAEEPSRRAQCARRPLGARHLGLQPGGPVPRQPRLRGAAGELPRFHGLRPQVLGSVVPRVGPQDAGRSHRRRAVADQGGHRRSEACRDLRRQLRRLRNARGSHVHAGPVRGRRRLRGRIQPDDVPEFDPPLLEAIPRDAAGNGRRHGEGSGDAQGRVAGEQRRQDQGAVADRPGGQGPARGEEQERPDGGGDAQTWRGGRVHREGQRGSRLPRPRTTARRWAVAMEKFLAKQLGGRFQADVEPTTQQRLDEITVDVSTVTLPPSEG